MIDTIPFDSAALQHTIVNTVNGGLNAIPPVNPIIDAAKMVLIFMGGFITKHFIHHFKVKNQKKAEKLF